MLQNYSINTNMSSINPQFPNSDYVGAPAICRSGAWLTIHSWYVEIIKSILLGFLLLVFFERALNEMRNFHKTITLEIISQITYTIRW